MPSFIAKMRETIQRKRGTIATWNQSDSFYNQLFKIWSSKGSKRIEKIGETELLVITTGGS